MDNTDIKILNLLQGNSKMTIKEMAEALHLSTTPIFDRIKKLEKQHIIDRYVAILDAKRLGKKLTVFVDLTITDHSLGGIQNFVEYIIQFPRSIGMPSHHRRCRCIYQNIAGRHGGVQPICSKYSISCTLCGQCSLPLFTFDQKIDK